MTEKAKVKGREKRRTGKAISSFVVLVLVLVLSVSLASVAIVSAQVDPPVVTGITVTASPTSIPADGNSISTITATTTWINEEYPDDGSGFKIWFEITEDDLGAVVGPGYVNTNESGVATAYLTAGLNEGTVTVKATWVRDTSFWDDTTVGLGKAVTYPDWDINEDGVTDYKDAAYIGIHYGETTSEPYPRYDINKDGTVDYKDAAYIGIHYGEVSP